MLTHASSSFYLGASDPMAELRAKESSTTAAAADAMATNANGEYNAEDDRTSPDTTFFSRKKSSNTETSIGDFVGPEYEFDQFEMDLAGMQGITS